MPKRKSEEKIKYYKEKLKKLQVKSDRRRVRRNIIQSESSDDNSDPPLTVEPENILKSPDLTEIEEIDPDLNFDLPSTRKELSEVMLEPELDPEYLHALGDAINDRPSYGDDIHPDLAQRWVPILRKGLQKDDLEKLVVTYLIPNNCQLLKAPSLNPEIKAAITESLRLRDKKIENSQQQLGIGISVLNKAISNLLVNGNKIETIKILCDATRILLDLHYQETQTRIKLLTLFGTNLSEKIKTAKIIEKQGLAIKKSIAPLKPTTNSSATRLRQENWSGPPRFSGNRGGRTTSRVRATTAVTHRSALQPSQQSQQPQLPRYNHLNRQRVRQAHRH